uniref:Endonuclease/exonuclease/phosphatase domain-containing protein n=1 Tax=Eptatretus burgeri TaxID=7764 RepID=A0A8C4QP07_EPTBU
MTELHIATLNINGGRAPLRRIQTIQTLEKIKADIILLQETHATNTFTAAWRKLFGGQWFLSGFPSPEAGVAICLSHNYLPLLRTQGGSLPCLRATHKIKTSLLFAFRLFLKIVFFLLRHRVLCSGCLLSPLAGTLVFSSISWLLLQNMPNINLGKLKLTTVIDLMSC